MYDISYNKLENVINFLEDKPIFKKILELSKVLERILKNNFNIKEKDEIILLTDKGFKDHRNALFLGIAYFLAAKRNNNYIRSFFQSNLTETPSYSVNQTIENLPKRGLIIGSLSQSIKRLNLKKKLRVLAKEKGWRFIATTGLGVLHSNQFKKLKDIFDIDYELLHKRSLKLKSKLDYANKVEVITDKGTDIKMSIKGIKAKISDGFFELGTGGNMPAGEVYIYPHFRDVNGKIVIDGTIKYDKVSLRVKNPVKIYVENGEITEIKGKEEADLLIKAFKKAQQKTRNAKRLCELGIGLNPNIKKLLGVTMIDEKALDTAHFAFGSNNWFGGYIFSTIHYDQVFLNPKIFVNGKEMIEYIKKIK